MQYEPPRAAIFKLWRQKASHEPGGAAWVRVAVLSDKSSMWILRVSFFTHKTSSILHKMVGAMSGKPDLSSTVM